MDIRGHVVREETGEPVAGATVVLDTGPGPAPDIAAVTDAQGTFSFHGLIPGQWLLVALTSDGGRGEAWFRASNDDVAEATIRVSGP